MAQNQKDYKESIKKLEEQLAMNQQQLNGDRARVEAKQESLDMVSAVVELQKSLQNEINSRKAAEEELNSLKNELVQWRSSMAVGNAEVLKLRKLLEDDKHQKEELEEEITELRKFEAIGNAEVLKLRKSLIDVKCQKETLEEEITGLEKFEVGSTHLKNLFDLIPILPVEVFSSIRQRFTKE
ncbi:hypothetical protein AQUCO_03200027v1 [Aquilegia coerulea]|uniref:Uncharacterized protein n=1 Tax=Aquilegia coerulea TaxID=218851 RepID=A0A2G5D0Q9_AQUCA|nr:hypothetical protein AQUCO_03200027v1 [Aquilegia coerulea]